MNTATNLNKKTHLRPRDRRSFWCDVSLHLWLGEVKQRRDLGEAAIGQIDTGSFMMKLFLLGGFRGIVADLLWIRAEDNKRDHDWDRLKTNVELITKLQPHFLSIWTFQGWNLAYNVSVEWDAPEDKYEWIKQGIKFVQEGVRKNRRSPDLIWDTAWFYYHKLGFSDESIMLRRLFRDDEEEDFKTYTDPATGHRVVGNDNFKLGYGWFSRAVGLVDDESGSGRITSGTGMNIQYVDPTPRARGAPTTSPSVPCPPMLKPATPPAWRRRAFMASRRPSAKSHPTSGIRLCTNGRFWATTSSCPSTKSSVAERWSGTRSGSTTHPTPNVSTSSRKTRNTGRLAGPTR